MKAVIIGKQSGSREDVSIDLDVLLRTRLLIQANSGGGKSWLLRRLAEQLFGKVPVIIIDPEGEFATLREKFGYVLVGDGGETPADPRTAPLVAQRLLELGASAVCDLYEAFRSRPSDRRLWVRRFLEALIDAPKKLWRPLVVMVDESHKFCPQENPRAGSPMEREAIMGAKEAMISLATTGRKRGFCAVWATQRLAKLDKDASAELLNRLVGLTFEDVDIDRALDLLSISRDERHDFKRQIRVVKPGQFFAIGRAVSTERILVNVGAVKTTHPEAGTAYLSGPPPLPEKIKHLLPKLADLPREAEQKARTEIDLKMEIKSLKAQLASRPAPAPVKAAETTKIVSVPVVAPKDLVRLEKVLQQLTIMSGKVHGGADYIRGFSDKIAEQITKISNNAKAPKAFVAKPPPPSTLFRRVLERVPPAPPAPSEEGRSLDKAQRAVLSVLAVYTEGCFIGKIALLAGYRVSGGFRNTLSALRTMGFMTGGNADCMKLTGAGMAALGDVDPLPGGKELIDYWLKHRSLGACERKILSVLLESPIGMTINDLAVAAGYEASGGFRNSLSTLRTAGLLVGKNNATMEACDELLEASRA